jgi:hypothetical protein
VQIDCAVVAFEWQRARAGGLKDEEVKFRLVGWWLFVVGRGAG